MQVITRINDIKISPRKIRLVADAIRNLSLGEALDALTVVEKRGAKTLEKALKSSMANALNNARLARSNLIIKTIDISQGPVMKRYDYSSRGHFRQYKKRSTNIRIVLEEKAVPAQGSEKQKEKGDKDSK